MNRKMMLPIQMHRKIYYCCALCLMILSGFGCQKTEQAIPDPTIGVEKPKEPAPALKDNLIPTMMNSKDLQIEFKYEGESNQLLEIIQSDGNLTKFFYRPNGSPLRYEQYKGNKLQQEIDCMIDKEGQVYKLLLFDGKSASTGYYAMFYNVNGQITTLKKYGANNLVLEEEQFSYDPFGNAITVVKTTKNTTSTMRNTYDSKSGIYRHIPYIQLLGLTQEHSKAIYAQNNLLLSDYLPIGTPVSNYTYEYNSNNYPSSIQKTQGANTETMKLSYKTFKPK
ncbi:hypothetical protein [Pedobacter gandavensis]|uniref:hypothetical protein n=1 Tax=Pedobacter gandavensis TaxID=2679963 RepID=UPI00292DB592|nr:hypothetical protein [Pedobacter gandavensis]